MKYLATVHPHDLHRAQSLLRKEGMPAAQWSWPVALAQEDGHVRAAVGTQLDQGLVIAGPMVLDRALGGRAPLVAYRLGRFYDRIMAGCGIQRYYAHVDENLSQFHYILKRLGFRDDQDDGAGGIWYVKKAGHWGQERRSDHEVPVDGLRQRVGLR